MGKIERHFNCNNPECNQNLKNRLVYIKKTQNLSETLQEGIRTQLSSEEYDCNACGGTISEGTVNLPPLLIVPGEVVGNDLPYNFEIFGKYEIVLYFLTLITVFDTMKKHFHCYFRLNTPAVSSVFFPSIPNLQETIGFLVYISSATENDFSIFEEQKISITIKKKHNERNTSQLTQLEEKSNTLFPANSFFAKELSKAWQD